MVFILLEILISIRIKIKELDGVVTSVAVANVILVSNNVLYDNGIILKSYNFGT